MTAPTISVVVPVYNGERFIAEALRSIDSQTRGATEVIVIDDGSTDATESVVRDRFPDVSYRRHPNGGVAVARNHGISAATGEWIAFLDADDVWYPQKLAVQCEEIAEHPEAGLVYSDLDRIDADGLLVEAQALTRASEPRRRGRRTDPSFLAFGGLPFPFPSTVMVRRETVLRAGGFNPAFRRNYHEDLDAFARVFHIAPVRFIPRSLVGYRVPAPTAPASSAIRDANWLVLLGSLWQLWSDEPARQALLVREYARHHAHRGKRDLRNGDYAAARRALRLALLYRPAMPKAWARLLLTYLPVARDLYVRRKAHRQA